MNLLDRYATPLEAMDSPKLIKWDLRNGQAIVLEHIKKVNEMICTRCGNDRGVVCRHDGVKYFAWFCSNYECIQDSSSKSKISSRKEYEESYHERLNRSEIAMKNKKTAPEKEVKFKFMKKNF